MKTLLLIVRVLVLALALSSASAPARAQEPAPASQLQSGASDPLPQPGQTTRPYWHLFAAFGVAWIALFGYAVSLNRRFQRLEEQVAAHSARRPTS